MSQDLFLYWLIRTLTYPISLLPYSWIHRIGRFLGSLAFYCMREYRKRALSNIALATDLGFNRKKVRQIAKESFQNLAINCLEYTKFAREKDFSRVIQCENPEIANALYAKGQGIIFFCGHQSNWEALFLDGTTRMQGVAIGKAIKNKRLYHWIVSIREKNGGKIISPHNALREGLKALKKGVFLGIVGDQGMPDSGYAFPFLGRRAWTSTAPALLAYRTNSPILFAETRRVRGGYRIRYSDPIWPKLDQPMEEEVVRMMNQLLTLLQESIQRSPGEWLWQHNRWKQQTPQNLYKQFRHDCLCVILPEGEAFETLKPHLQTLRQIYPKDFLFLQAPASLRGVPLIEADEILYYKKLDDVLVDDFRFKIVFNFANHAKAKSHFERLSAFEVLTLDDLHQIASPFLIPGKTYSLSDIWKRALCRPGTLWTNG